ncbi:MAG TPA: DNA primase [Flavobacteriales bacterium]|jgi:DNA primase|nr:DNA primase [Flavobacteriales bacterium]
MINRQTIDRIFEAARIEEVIGEFLTLKKAGSNFKALSPFTNEKTPSFFVSPTKNIFKDFSSGKGGNVVTFLMEHEQMSYPEALRYLAKKYNIEIEEEEETDEEKKESTHRESLYLINKWAESFYTDTLFNDEEGKSIGLEYFRERGFTQQTIEAFGLGYSPDKGNRLLLKATEEGRKRELLEELGLIKERNGNYYDGFRGRVIFPVHNLSGRPVAFGGRILRNDIKAPKYLNSPESAIYEKHKVLYGLYQAKSEIIRNDLCYLVEGYTDVLMMHQAGIQNVVSSSGTALSTDQVRLISRFSKNITIIFDADPAGIKASFRGIDMFLEQGLNVRTVALPEGEDPDSFARKHDTDYLSTYLKDESLDFILFKTNILSSEASSDPIKRTEMIRDVVSSIALIPDAIARTVYVKECAEITDISEKVLISELNKIRVAKFRKVNRAEEEDIQPADLHATDEPEIIKLDTSYQERDILRLMINYGTREMELEAEEEPVKLADFVASEILEDELTFENELYHKVFNQYLDLLSENESRDPVAEMVLSADQDVQNAVVSLLSSPYDLHKWESKSIHVQTEEMRLFRSIREAIYAFKVRKIEQMVTEMRKELEELQTAGEDFILKLKEIDELEKVKRKFLAAQGITILR